MKGYIKRSLHNLVKIHVQCCTRYLIDLSIQRILNKTSEHQSQSNILSNQVRAAK